MKRTETLVYSNLLLVVSVIGFLIGFFPLKKLPLDVSSQNDLPGNVSKMSLNPQDFYKPKIDKLVIMVIDALRFDFVINDYPYMPFLKSSLESGLHCPLKVKVEAPTVTMPRIKALMSGTVPAYSDVIMNLFSKEAMPLDNLLHQAKIKGLSTVFYGDLTWLNLFPDSFIRSEGTTSFIVTDYTEVDYNVSRNVAKELQRTDWDFLILHYLGLDHIGHVEGPSSPLVKPKLIEMDNIIKEIFNYIEAMKTDNKRVVLLVCSDHGMKNTGGHGGTSYAEIFTPYVFLNYQCDTSLSEEVNQIDITPMLAVMLGVPIPAASMGKLHYKLLIKEMEIKDVLYSLYYNSKRLFDFYSILEPSQDIYALYQLTELDYNEIIRNNFTSVNVGILENYMHIQNTMSNELVKSSVNYDLPLMFIGMLLMVQVMMAVYFQCQFCMNKKRLCAFFFTIIIEQAMKPYVIFINGTTVNPNLFRAFEILALGNFFFLKPDRNVYINLRNRICNPSRWQYIVKVQFSQNFIVYCCMFLHMTSQASTSFIEEEQELWFFAASTYLLIGYLNGGKWCLPALVIHTVLKYMNRSGVAYANDPCIKDWLKDERNVPWLILFYLIGLLHSFYWCTKNILEKYKYIYVHLLVFIYVICCALFKISEVIEWSQLKYLRDILPVSIIWILFAIILLVCTLNLKIKASQLFDGGVITISHMCDGRTSLTRKFVAQVIDIGVLLTIMILILVLKPYNIFIITCILTISDEICRIPNLCALKLIALHLGLGMICFFYQGNSNGLATVDVSAGFIGSEEPPIILSALLITFNTFGAQILSTFLLMRDLYNNPRWVGEEPACLEVVLFSSAIYILDYALIITLQRHHLFIWSVFSPKLLYVASFVAIYSAISVLVLFLPILYWKVFMKIVALF